MTAAPPPPLLAAYRIAFLGFSDFERTALASYFRLASEGVGRYEIVFTLTDANFLVADADHAPSVQLVVMTEREAETVFIGSHAPPGAAGSMRRPIDALHVLRALDALSHREGAPAVWSPRAVPALPASPGLHAHPASGSQVDLDLELNPPMQPVDQEQGVIVQSMLHMPPPRSAAVAVPSPVPAHVPSPSLAPAPILALEQLRSGFENRTPPATVAMPDGLAAARTSVAGRAASSRAAFPPASPNRSALAAAHRTSARARQGQVPALVAVGPPGPARALVVDDSAVAQRFLASKLLPWDVRSDTAANSDEALAMLAQRAYDFVFLDLELGAASAMDGLTLCRHIKRSELAMGATVAIVSAHQSEIDRARGALAGCDGFLGKPLSDADLSTVLRQHGLKAPGDAPLRPAAAAGIWPA